MENLRFLAQPFVDVKLVNFVILYPLQLIMAYHNCRVDRSLALLMWNIPRKCNCLHLEKVPTVVVSILFTFFELFLFLC